MALPTKKWLKQAEIYKMFLEDDWVVDLSDEMASEMFVYESTGKGNISKNNGYYIGKKWCNVFVTMYKHDIAEGLLLPSELLEDFPSWWLESIGIL